MLFADFDLGMGIFLPVVFAKLFVASCAYGCFAVRNMGRHVVACCECVLFWVYGDFVGKHLLSLADSDSAIERANVLEASVAK